MAHTDTTPAGPGANDNASGVGVVMALAPRLRRLRPACDVWLVATGAEERIYTRLAGPPRRAGARPAGARARPAPAAALGAVAGRGGPRPRLLAALTRRWAAHARVEGELLRAARRAGATVRWMGDEGSGNSDHREFQLLGMRAAKLGVDGAGEPCRHMACDRKGRLSGRALGRARLLVERALSIR